MKHECSYCTHWEAIGNKQGRCHYEPPPVVRRIYQVLHAEPSTHVDWRRQLWDEPFVTPYDFHCSEWRHIVEDLDQGMKDLIESGGITKD